MTENKLYIKITNIQKLLNFLKYCKETHQGYVDNPKYCRGNIGSRKHHEECVKRYEEIIKIIREMKRKKING